MRSPRLEKQLNDIAEIDTKILQAIKITKKDIHYDQKIPGPAKLEELKKRLRQDKEFMCLVKGYRQYLELYKKTDDIIYELVGET